jgi:uncharacterized protein (DUF302 family)
MRVIINIFAIVGLVSVLATGFLYAKATKIIQDFDTRAPEVYKNFFNALIETKNPAATMVRAVPVEEGISVDEIKESMKSLATQNGMLFVSESPFYKQVEAVTGKPFRHITFMNFCNSKVGMAMANYSDSYTSFMPCNISIVEDTQGKLWIYHMNMDLLIYGGKELPAELKATTLEVKRALEAIVDGAAKGDF